MKKQKYLKSKGKDELYCEWFECDECKEDVAAYSNFCQGCGQDLRIKMPV